MRKKKNRRSFIGKIFHKPFFIIFLFILLPFILWAVQQSQQYFSRAQSFNCPTTSAQTYQTLGLKGHEIENELPIDQNSDINISLRSYQEVNQKPALVDYGGDTDPDMPPSLGTLFTHTPTIVKTYQVHQWDFQSKTRKPELETAWPVSVIGLATNPGEPLVGLKAGREIGGGFILMVIFATPTSVTFNYSDDESGYPIYVDNLCVDPNLVSAYQSANAGGRHELPAIRTGQVFGYGNGSDVRIAIRDTGSWMDPRSRKDWWQGSDAISGNSNSPTNNVTAPTLSVPTQIPPSPNIPTLTSTPVAVPTVNFIPATAVPVQPTAKPNNPAIIYISATPILLLPTSIAPTATPTPAPLVDVKKTINTAKSIWSNIIVSILQFTKAILP